MKRKVVVLFAEAHIVNDSIFVSILWDEFWGRLRELLVVYLQLAYFPVEAAVYNPTSWLRTVILTHTGRC